MYLIFIMEIPYIEKSSLYKDMTQLKQTDEICVNIVFQRLLIKKTVQEYRTENGDEIKGLLTTIRSDWTVALSHEHP